jgi:hypothetical protein|tara:strand:+ start:220 stop:912 length:693 start_codon:yes stop_codon:yes gene_type:complete
MNKVKPVTKTGAEMQNLLISIRLPDGHWAGDSSRQNHHVTIRIEEHMALPRGRGSAQGTARGYELEKFKGDISGHHGVENVIFFGEEGDLAEMNVTISRGGGGFLRPLIEAEVLPQTPFEVRDGWVEWEFATDNTHMRKLMAGLKESGLPHRIHSLSNDTAPRLLTVRQREVFDLAVMHGYYDTPRKITLTELAGKAGVSKSTLCEMVHLIEKHIIDEFSESVRRQSPKE